MPMSIRYTLYYHIRPLIPRSLQISLRRQMVRKRRSACEAIWPIDPNAGSPPRGWTGWPENKRFALVLTHDAETDKGHRNCHRVMELEKKLGFRSSFGFVPERYNVSPDLRHSLEENGFEVIVHGLCHDGKYYNSRKIFQVRAKKINHYLREWGSVGFRSPSMMRNLDWLHDLNMEYDSSTFDTDPFQPQPDGVGTIFPFWVPQNGKKVGYVEIPCTLPQDHTLFVIMQEKTIDIWKKKLDWISANGGMALLITHPDYMNFGGAGRSIDEYPVTLYAEFLEYVNSRYRGNYWNPLPKEIVRFWNSRNGASPAGEKG